MASEIVIDHLSKVYGNPDNPTTAVDDVSLTIKKGSFTTIVGPSGSGKTTLLRTIAGLEEPSEGRILLGNKDITNLPPQKRELSMVFQNIALFPHLNVRENIGYGLKVQGVSKQERNAKIDEIAEVLGIRSQLDKKPSELSGGQRQRVALGAGIVEEPEVLLLDEPMSDLDAKLKEELRVEMKRMHKATDVTMVYVTHDQVEAMTMSDEIVVMNHGNIEQYDSPSKTYSSPNSEFVAQFIGQPPINLFDYSVIRDSGKILLQGDGPDIEFMEESLNISNSSLRVGIRPSEINVPGQDHLFSITVNLVEEHGREIVIFGSVETEDSEKEVRVITEHQEEIDVGATLEVGFDRDAILLFEEGKLIKSED